METIIIQANAKKSQYPYDPEFVKMVLKASKQEGSTPLKEEYN